MGLTITTLRTKLSLAARARVTTRRLGLRSSAGHIRHVPRNRAASATRAAVVCSSKTSVMLMLMRRQRAALRRWRDLISAFLPTICHAVSCCCVFLACAFRLAFMRLFEKKKQRSQ